MIRKPLTGSQTLPNQSRMFASLTTSELRIVALSENHCANAENTLRVPSVAMNGGNLSRVTSKPFPTPHASPSAIPKSRPSQGFQPQVTASFPIVTELNSVMAPTERSMPAVRMMIVWAIPKVPMIMTWARIVDTLVVVRNLSPKMLKNTKASNSTAEGLARGRLWRNLCRRLTAV